MSKGEKERRKMTTRSREGAGEDQKGEEWRAQAEGRWRESRICWKSVAWSEQPMGREGKQPKENENNSSSVPTTQAPRSRIFVILLGSWFVFIF